MFPATPPSRPELTTLRHWLAILLLGPGLLGPGLLGPGLLGPGLLGLGMLAAPAARAAEGAVATTPEASASLVTDTDAVEPGRPLHLALRLRLAPGWHTYWTNPGDAGAAPELALTLPPGASAGPIAWPAPQALPEGPLMAYAYTGDVVLPVTLSPGTAGGELRIAAHASWLACATLCVPREADLALTLPEGRPAPSAEAPLFAAAAARTPVPTADTARIAADGTLSLSGPDVTPARVRAARFFPLDGGVLVDAAAQALRVRDGALTLSLQPGPHFNAAASLDGVLALDGPDGPRFVTLAATPDAPLGAVPDAPLGAVPGAPLGAAPGAPLSAVPGTTPGATPTAPAETGAIRALLLALAGGVLLNLMPCVFPVLAMKAVGLARLSGAARGTVRAQAVSYVAGVLAAFAALGGVMLGLRAAGSAAGWGFQFQSPVFVLAMALVLFAVGLALSGVVAVGGAAGGRLGGAGQSLAGRGGHGGSFFTGLLAVLVATPCTAPFMGAAVAAAFAAPIPLAFAVFLAMGAGLAAPYAVLAALPGLARVLPRPGPWMEVLRQGLAFPMYAAAAWLVWVASEEAGPAGVLAAGAGLVLIGFAAWAWRMAQGATGPDPASSLVQDAGQNRTAARRVGQGAAVAACLAVLAVLAGLGNAPPAPLPVDGAGTEAFSVARLDALRAAGRPVFVNMTASWCVTCLVNERLALSPPAVRDAFARHQVATLRGDWTRQDPEITAFLREHGRDGVPLYVFYPAGRADPAVLPQILTEGTVLAAVARGG